MGEAYLLPLSDGASFDVFLSRLAPEQRARVQRLRCAPDRQRSLAGQLLARALLCRLLRADNRALRFAAGDHGKPYLPQFPHVGFNISHTAHGIAVALGEGPVGVDVERDRPVRPAVANRFFTPEEARWVFSGGRGGQNRRFVSIWTRKEACAKYTGLGLSLPLASLDTLSSEFSQMLRTFRHGGYTVSVCADAPPEKLRLLCESRLLEMAAALSPYPDESEP